MKTKITGFALWLLFSPAWLYAQVTLEHCQQQARSNYPLVVQTELLQQARDYQLENLRTGWYPQVQVMGQASYQSEVTSLPIKLPGVTVPALSKDQYRVYADINQALFDGGITRQQRRIQESGTAVELQKVEVELYKIREKVNQLYFGILLTDAQLQLNDLVVADLTALKQKTEAALKLGTVLPSDADLVKAEYLKAMQRAADLRAQRKEWVLMLSRFTGNTLSPEVKLQMPAPEGTAVPRPEYALFQRQQEMMEAQYHLLTARNLPRLSAFLQAGYGRPALNMLSNQFEQYYIGGVRLNWNLNGWYTLNRDRSILKVNKDLVESQHKLFDFQTSIAVSHCEAEQQRLNEISSSDAELLTLREKIKTASEAKLQQGVITTADYLRELHALDAARESQRLHAIQSAMNSYQYQYLTGKKQ